MQANAPDGDDLLACTMAPEGASQDLVLRALQPILAARFGRRLRIENATGEDGMRAARIVKAAPADGRHLLVTASATLTFYPARGDAGFARGDFDMLLGVGRYNFVVITGPQAPASDLVAILAAIREQGRALRYAGSGEPDRLLVAAMARAHGLALEFMPRNGPALLQAVTSGAADFGLGTGTHQPLLAAGRVRVVAQLHPRAGATRYPAPRDFGVDAALDNFILIAAPRGVAAAERRRLVGELGAAIAAPEIQAVLRERLLMSPGLLEGAALEAALDEQERMFTALRSGGAAG
jgi:tripartite-type tricarboxylate transporter receptor subunit TctC